jgi:hypothetical protein
MSYHPLELDLFDEVYVIYDGETIVSSLVPFADRLTALHIDLTAPAARKEFISLVVALDGCFAELTLTLYHGEIVELEGVLTADQRRTFHHASLHYGNSLKPAYIHA